MSKRNKKARAEPKQKRSIIGFYDMQQKEKIKCSGYRSLAESPEIIAGVNRIARLVGAMTIHLMENTENGDIRIQNELSRKVDINPYSNSTRSHFMEWIIRTLFLNGNGNAVVYPVTQRGYLTDLLPIPPAYVSFLQEDEWGYSIMINGKKYDPGEVLHFRLDPDALFPWKGTGPRVALAQVANNLKQAAATTGAFMSDKWKPSIIVKVDALTDEFSDKEGRRKLLDEYIQTSEAGEPWLIPADQFSVEQVKPLSLSDLALAEFVELDKKTVASILEVPPFVLGVGEYGREEWNNFINTRIMTIGQSVQQELTKKLLYKPNWYFRLNPRSLYNYDLRDLATIGFDGAARGIMSRNEARDWISLSPLEGLDELVMLENYIPAGMIGDQKKLNQTGGGENK